jgi:hypothetical protein
VARFLWDLIDAHNEVGQDDTNESMSSLALIFQNRTCAASSGYGVDGTCNEPNRSSSSNCVPSNGDIPLSPAFGNRDSYNAWDIGDSMPGNQTSERTINCVQGATD